MSAAGVAAAGRRAAERLMADRCVIGDEVLGPLDPVTKKYTPTIPNPTYPVGKAVGRCRIRAAQGMPNEVDAAGQQLANQRYILSLPVIGSELVDKDQVVVYGSSATDPALPGRRFRVVAPTHQSDATARRFQVEEVVE